MPRDFTSTVPATGAIEPEFLGEPHYIGIGKRAAAPQKHKSPWQSRCAKDKQQLLGQMAQGTAASLPITAGLCVCARGGQI